MRAALEPMTIAQLKRSMDHRFVRLNQSMDRRFTRLERNKADKSDVRRLKSDLRRLAQKTDRRFGEVRLEFERTRQEIARSAEETRRHFDTVAESLRDDFRLFADAIAGQTERLDQHEMRIGRLERRAP